jgi:cytidylate kinase
VTPGHIENGFSEGVKTMSVITISRDLGSAGDYIAEKTARALGYHFVDKEFFAAVLSQYGLVDFDREYDDWPGFFGELDPQRYKDRDEAMAMLNRAVRAVAQHGNVVILGRSGYEVLRGYSDIVHARLQAPLPIRITRVMAELSIPFEQAEELVRKNDKVHVAFVTDYYEIPWDAIQAFDLVINTGKVSPDLATAWLVDAARALGTIPLPDKPATRSIEVDPILRATVSDVLQCQLTHG